MDEISKVWGSILLELRKESGLGERPAAQRAGVSRRSLRKWESGEYALQVSNLEKVLNSYGYELEAVKK